MKTLWILYLITCPICDIPNCEGEKRIEISSHDYFHKCMKKQRQEEHIRLAMGHWNDTAEFKCVKS